MRGTNGRRRSMSAAIGAMLLGIVTSTSVLAGSDFGAPQQLFSGSYYEIDATSDNDGDIHAVARGNTGLWYLTDTGGSWTRERLTEFAPFSADRDPAIAVDAQDHAYIAYESNWCTQCAPSTNDGIGLLTNASGSFPNSPTMISNNSSVDPDIAVHSGDVYISYARCECLPKQPTAPVFLWTDASGSATRTKIRNHGTETSVAVNDAGKPRVAFEDDPGIFYAKASTITGGWNVTEIPGTNASDARPILDLSDIDGNPWIAFARNNGIWAAFRVSFGGWTTDQITPARGIIDFLLTDADEKLVALDRNTGGVFVKGFFGYSDTVSSAAEARDVAITQKPNGEVVVLFTARAGVPQGVYLSHD